jgi:hypothetical protein
MLTYLSVGRANMPLVFSAVNLYLTVGWDTMR